MKITFVLPHVRISGGVKALIEYANRLQNMGNIVRIFIPEKKPKWYRLDKKLKPFKSQFEALPPETVDWMKNYLPIEIFSNINSNSIPDADIIVASAWETADFVAKLPSCKGKTFYFVQHYESLWSRKKSKASKTYDLPIQTLTISTWLKNILKENHNQSAALLVTPVDHSIFNCNNKNWNTPRRICMLHHDYNWKGYTEGIETIRKVRAQGKNVDLVVFGEKIKNPKSLFESAGFSFEYHYRPLPEHLRDIYSSCDIYLCPSWYEGLGMPAMEAMACKSALVTTDTGGCRDYAINNKTALISPAQDINSLAFNLIRLLNDASLLESISKNGHQKILELTWEKNCSQLQNIFKSALTKKNLNH